MKVNIPILSILTVIAVLISGCATPVAIDPLTGQQQTAKYQAGYFHAPIAADADKVFKTAIRAIDKMGILRTGELHQNKHITIYARKVGDQKVMVRITQVAAGESQLRIRVGTLGNLADSQTIYANIRNAL